MEFKWNLNNKEIINKLLKKSLFGPYQIVSDIYMIYSNL